MDQTQTTVNATAAMLIRRPVAEVFEAFINPEITTQFWFTKSSGRVEEGKRVRWEWEMYNAANEAEVKTIEANKRIVIDWFAHGHVSAVEWTFTPLGEDATFVSITATGFQGDDASIAQQ